MADFVEDQSAENPADVIGQKLLKERLREGCSRPAIQAIELGNPPSAKKCDHDRQ